VNEKPILVLGTRNRKKREEIVALLDDLDLDFADLTQWPNLAEVEEDGDTFEANAIKKATQFAASLHRWVLGEDSGLVVPVLNGRPGIFSARFGGQHSDDAANNARLLEELKPFHEDQRRAFYVSAAALADPQGTIRTVVQGRCNGQIVTANRGTGGFGYDPLFLIPEYHKTFGELSSRVKHALSHRSRALSQLRPALRLLIQSEKKN
jgi:XTP/dITP diphosphohydrolase